MARLLVQGVVLAALWSVVILFAAVFMNPSLDSAPMIFVPPGDSDGTIVHVGSSGATRRTFSVIIEETRLHCWLYLPPSSHSNSTNTAENDENDRRPPVVLMAYGLGVQKDIALTGFAENLLVHDFASVVFDYRHWGLSEGMPRHYTDTTKQILDLQSVLIYIVQSNGLNGLVDHTRIHLYGASLGGGHVVTVAGAMAREDNSLLKNIRSVIAYVPFFDGAASSSLASQKRSLMTKLRIFSAVIWDMVRGYYSPTSAVYIRIATLEEQGGTSAFILPAEEYELWAGRTPLVRRDISGNWENKLAARSLLNLLKYRPIEMAKYITTPLLAVASKRDALCPIESVRATVKVVNERAHEKGKAGRATLMELSLGHFTMVGPLHFNAMIKSLVEFMKQNQ